MEVLGLLIPNSILNPIVLFHLLNIESIYLLILIVWVRIISLFEFYNSSILIGSAVDAVKQCELCSCVCD